MNRRDFLIKLGLITAAAATPKFIFVAKPWYFDVGKNLHRVNFKNRLYVISGLDQNYIPVEEVVYRRYSGAEQLEISYIPIIQDFEFSWKQIASPLIFHNGSTLELT